MVIEIALGIVLVVVILRFWPVLLGLGVLVLAIMLLLVVVGIVVWVVMDDPTALVILGVIAAATAGAVSLNRKGQKDRDDLRRRLGYEGRPDDERRRDL